jgi:hypothetical protein
VDDAEFEKCQISLREMPHEGLSLGLAQPLILPILLEIVLEIAVLAVLQHHVDVLSRSEIIIQFDDKRRLQCSQVFYLILDLFLDVFIYLLDIDALDCHLHPRIVLPVEDGSGCPGPQGMGFKDSVSSHLFDHLIHLD